MDEIRQPEVLANFKIADFTVSLLRYSATFRDNIGVSLYLATGPGGPQAIFIQPSLVDPPACDGIDHYTIVVTARESTHFAFNCQRAASRHGRPERRVRFDILVIH